LTIDCNNKYFQINGGLWDGYNLYKLYQEAATPYSWQADIKTECKKTGLDFLSTPFDEDGVDFLESLNVGAYKVASFELVHIPLIKYIARKGKPMFVSCGMGSIEEIEEAVDAMTSEGLSKEQIILLKCTSEYPAKPEDMNLLTIPDMEKKFGCRVGLSDHSMGHVAVLTAVALGACVIEKHFCLSRTIKNPDCEFSMEPQEFSEMVRGIRAVEKVRGEVSYKPGKTEEASLTYRRSIFATKDIAKGEKFNTENIKVIRPGYGMKPKYYDEVIGKKAKENISFGEPLFKEHVDFER
jgi:pseudaminic acid synthase